ncbi:hypothetical protein C8Q73DRAFT_529799 [Cubamyces lactineus]|nr:hypothetical protein C8Q73DRAFT_529799 [Cubamyces lactineus]
MLNCGNMFALIWSTALPANYGGSVACSVRRLERTIPSVVNVEARMKDPRQGKPISSGMVLLETPVISRSQLTDQSSRRVSTCGPSGAFSTKARDPISREGCH